MSSYSWEQQFGNLVKDTENHLAKARQKLAKSQQNNSRQEFSPSHHLSIKGRTQNLGHGHRSPPVRSTYSLPTFPENQSSYRAKSLQTMPERNKRNENNALAFLSDQVDRQAKIVEELNQKVHRLEIEKDRCHTHIHDLEREMQILKKKFSEDNANLYIEQKFERWVGDVRSQIDDLQGQIMHSSRRSVAKATTEQDDLLLSLNEELRQIKRHLQSECDALHREMEVIRSKLVSQEVEVTGTESGQKEIKRQLDNFKEDYHSQMQHMDFRLSQLDKAPPVIQEGRQLTAAERPFTSIENLPPRRPSLLSVTSSVRQRTPRRTHSGSSRDRKNSPLIRSSIKMPFKTTPQLTREVSVSSLTKDSESDSEETFTKWKIQPPLSHRADKNDLGLSDLDLHSDEEDKLLSALESSLDSESL